MPDWLVFLIGFAAGAAGSVVWLANHFRAQTQKAQGRAQVAEATLAETRRQVEEKNAELEKLRKALEQEQQTRIASVTRLEEATKNIEEQRKILSEAQQKLSNTFKALSDDALKSNNQAFLQLAKQSLETVLSEAKGDFGKREEAISSLVKPLDEALRRYESQVGKMEQERAKNYGSLEEQLRALMVTQQQLQKETGNLVSALRKPQVRGRWGELTLRRVVELAGMTEHCDYSEQFTVENEEGRLRPDLVIHLPAGRQVVVDCKVSLDAYLDAIAAVNEGVRETALMRHAQQLRKHMMGLSSKSYWNELETTPEFVVMFIPGESFVSAAVESDPTLMEDGIANRVVIATPTTLIALVRAIAFGWRQEQIAKNAQIIAEHGRQVYERFNAFLEHVKKMRKSLEDSVFAFNRMVASMEGRVLPSIRKFKELGAAGGEEIPLLEPIGQTPRQLETIEPLEQVK